MKVIAAYLLALLGGNKNPTADDLKNILASVGAEADETRIELLLSQVKDKDITELIAAGREKLASVPAAGAVAVTGAAPAAAPGATYEAKLEEKNDEAEESEEEMSLMDIFN